MDKNKINLGKRYLFWLYKTLKESLDRIDRKFTQLEIDEKMFKALKGLKAPTDKIRWQRLLDEFRGYIDKKEKDAKSLSYSNFPKVLNADYLFLKSKLRIVEKLIKDKFGYDQLRRIKSLYEEEMIKRIIQEREHR